MKNIHVICVVEVSEDLHLGTQCQPCHDGANQASQEELARPQDNQDLQENSTTSPVQEESMTPERALHEIRSQMTPENARRQTKADSTFKKHNQENSRLLWWLYSTLRRVPSDWEFPAGPVLNIYRYWHHGDEVRSISPLKLLIKRDLSWKKGVRWVRQLEEVKRICRQLDKEAKDHGYLSDKPSRIQVVHAFYKAKHVFGLNDKTPKGRKRNFGKMTLGTIAREHSRAKQRASSS
jgi:hypothetical protein